MKLKDGKRYETADGQVFKVRSYRGSSEFFEVGDYDTNVWKSDGSGVGNADLIRRHYKKPQPSHKLDLKPGDVVELCGWEDGDGYGSGTKFGYDDLEIPSESPKGQRPLFKVVSRA